MNKNEFGRSIGLKRTVPIYAILRGEYGISENLAKSITGVYKDINYEWLLTGEGEMLSNTLEEPPCCYKKDDNLDELTLEVCREKLKLLEKENERLWSLVKELSKKQPNNNLTKMNHNGTY